MIDINQKIFFFFELSPVEKEIILFMNIGQTYFFQAVKGNRYWKKFL